MPPATATLAPPLTRSEAARLDAGAARANGRAESRPPSAPATPVALEPRYDDERAHSHYNDVRGRYLVSAVSTRPGTFVDGVETYVVDNIIREIGEAGVWISTRAWSS